MARKVLNRKELREENDAAEAAGPVEAGKEPAAKKKAPAKRKPRTQGRKRGAAEGILGRLQPVATADCRVRLQPADRGRQEGGRFRANRRKPPILSSLSKR